MSADASQLLREGLLEGVVALLAGGSQPTSAGGAASHDGVASHDGAADDGSVADTVARAYERLGARVLRSAAAAFEAEAAQDAAEAEVQALLGEAGAIDVLVLDAGALHARAAGAREALGACLQGSWVLSRALAANAFLAPERPGRILYLAPPPQAGEHAEAACAGLENLARTLSIEWARRQVTVVAIAPGRRTRAGELAALCAYLASPAGAYFSGCLLDLRGPAGG